MTIDLSSLSSANQLVQAYLTKLASEPDSIVSKWLGQRNLVIHNHYLTANSEAELRQGLDALMWNEYKKNHHPLLENVYPLTKSELDSMIDLTVILANN